MSDTLHLSSAEAPWGRGRWKGETMGRAQGREPLFYLFPSQRSSRAFFVPSPSELPAHTVKAARKRPLRRREPRIENRDVGAKSENKPALVSAVTLFANVVHKPLLNLNARVPSNRNRDFLVPVFDFCPECRAFVTAARKRAGSGDGIG